MVTTSALGAQVTETLCSRDLSEDSAYVLSLCFQEGMMVRGVAVRESGSPPERCSSDSQVLLSQVHLARPFLTAHKWCREITLPGGWFPAMRELWFFPSVLDLVINKNWMLHVCVQGVQGVGLNSSLVARLGCSFVSPFGWGRPGFAGYLCDLLTLFSFSLVFNFFICRMGAVITPTQLDHEIWWGNAHKAYNTVQHNNPILLESTKHCYH